MKPGYHTTEIAYKGCPYSAKIDMDKHKKGHKEPDDNMNKVIDSQSAAA